MNKQVSRGRGAGGTTPSINSGPATRPSKLIGSSASPRLGSGFGRQDDLLEIDGDALVVIDDDEWNADAAGSDAPAEESESNGMVSLRLDTAAVGGVLLAGVVAVAFLLGRTSGAPTEPAQQVVEVAVTDATPTPSQPAAAPTATTVPVSAGRVQATTVAGAPRPAPSPEPVATPAISGDYELIVVSTTPEKAQAVADWMNTNARSPIFGRADLQAFARKGGVRIRGFAKREGDVERRVRATSDPTNGGSGTFNDAYYVKSR